MKLDITRVRRAVIVAPHPDDEIIGAAGLILALKRHDARIRVVVVSDGAASHPASRRWPPKRLVGARRRESLLALRRLGIPAGNVRFLGLPDGALPQHLPRCRQLVRRAVGPGQNLIVGPAATDAHPDHRAVAMALGRGFGAARRLSYHVWPPRAGAIARGRRVSMRGGHAAKRSLLRLYRTQLGAITDDPTGFTIARHELAAFAHPLETFVEVRR